MTAHSERKHARFAPSAAHRWVNCPGSVSLSEQFPNKSSPAADEGTAAHQMAERCLNKGWDAADHYTTDNTIKVRDGVEIKVPDEMIEGVQLYLDYVRKIFDQCDEFAIEARLDISSVHPECFGTGDAIGYDQLEQTLHVLDFKFGRKFVDPNENYQGIAYAIGALKKYHNRKVSKIVVHIVQPRVSSKPMTWEVNIAALNTYANRLALAARNASVEPIKLFRAGDWCEYCPAAAVCPTLETRALAVAKDEFGVIPEPDRLTRKDLGKVLSNLDVLEDWCKRVRAFAYDEAMAGRPVDGFKLVQRRAVRKWMVPDAAAQALRVFDLNDDEIYERKIRSPAQMEKLLSKEDRKAMADLVVKVSSGVTLAPDSDKRPAISPAAALEFSKVEIDE